jgi:hypothetical protein
MYEESVATFEYLVRERRPVKEILHADYTFLNKPLAKFYGIDEKLAPATTMRKVDGVSKFDRGGALRLGTVLTTTSAPLRTSPVKRGDWILRRILSTPTPPPPPDAGHAAGRRQELRGPDAAAAADRAQARRQVRRLPPAHRSARLPARGLRRGRPLAQRLQRRQAGRHDRRVPRQVDDRRLGRAPRLPADAGRQGADDAVAQDDRLRARAATRSRPIGG